MNHRHHNQSSNQDLPWVLGQRWMILPVLMGMTLLAGLQLPHLRVEQDNESMNAISDADAAARQTFQDHFNEPESIVVALSGTDFTKESGRDLLESVTSRFNTIVGVNEVLSLASFLPGGKHFELMPLDLLEKRLAESTQSALFLSGDHLTAGIMIEIVPQESESDYRGRIISEVSDVLSQIPQGIHAHLSGVVLQKHEVARLIQRDQQNVFPACLAVMIIALLLLFRSAWGVIIPLSVTAISLVWTMGLYSFTGNELNTVTSLLPPVVMVLAVATSVHYFQSWQDSLRDGFEPIAASSAVLKKLARPSFFTALTTAIGLGALMLNDTPAVRLFGLFGAVGVMSAFLVSILMLPSLLLILPASRPEALAEKEDWLSSFLKGCAVISTRFPWRVLACALLITALALAALPSVRIDTDLIRFLKEDNVLRQDTAFIDRELAGSHSLDMMISRKDGAALEPSHADSRLRDFQAQLQMVPGITAILSAWGDEHTSSFPEYIADKGRLARMTLFLKAIGSEKGDELLTRLQSEASHSLGRDYQVDFSGTFYHVIRDSNHLVERQVKSFGLSLCLALIAVGVLFKSFRLMLMAFVPNVIPIAWSIGLMVLLDIPLSTGTAMIASVTIGIALDDTIYYLASLQAKKGEGTLREALTLTTVRTGRALLISSVVLALGFWCGCLGSFMPTIYFALLTGITMLSALLCDLIILPACLVITEAGWVQRRAEERNTGGCVSESS